MEVPKEIFGLIGSYREEHAVLRLVFDGDSVRDVVDVRYLCPNRYQLFFEPLEESRKGPVLSRNSLKLYVTERIRQGEDDDYDLPYDALRISIGRLPQKPKFGFWDLDDEMWCMMVGIDITDEHDVERVNIRLDIWLDIFEESWV